MHVTFMDLHKDYEALYRYRRLDVLEGYGVGTRVRRTPQEFLDRIRMVVRAGEYDGYTFRVFWGATQGDPLFPTIFNVMVESVVRHWDLLVEERAGCQEGCGRES